MGVRYDAPRLTARRLATASLCLIVVAAPAAAQVSRASADRPAAPANCEWMSDAMRRLTSSCSRLRSDEDAELRRSRPQPSKDAAEFRRGESQRQGLEPSGFSFASFLKYLHTDVLWTPSETGAGLQGLVGVHLVIANIGRVHFFGPPGVMLVMQNTSTGKMVRVASTWGTSIYLVDFRLPGSRQGGKLFVNLGKAWTTGDQRTGINMIGLSATWRK